MWRHAKGPARHLIPERIVALLKVIPEFSTTVLLRLSCIIRLFTTPIHRCLYQDRCHTTQRNTGSNNETMTTSSQQTSSNPGTNTNDTPIEHDHELDIIYHNMDISSDFSTCRFGRFMSVEKQLCNLGRQIEDGCFDFVLSVTARQRTHSLLLSVRGCHRRNSTREVCLAIHKAELSFE